MQIDAQLNWTEGMQFVARSGDGPALVLDNPEGNSGASPMEVLLMGVAGCTGMDVISILKKKRAPFSGLQINISGRRAEAHPKRYTHIEMEFVVRGKAVKPNDVQRAIELSATKYCSAIASLTAEIRHRFTIVD